MDSHSILTINESWPDFWLNLRALLSPDRIDDSPPVEDDEECDWDDGGAESWDCELEEKALHFSNKLQLKTKHLFIKHTANDLVLICRLIQHRYIVPDSREIEGDLI